MLSKPINFSVPVIRKLPAPRWERGIVKKAMPTWDPNQYEQFAVERARPCRDLIAAIQLASPPRIVDLGCGPGNSAAVLAERWPYAEITGIDTSAEMIEAAKAATARGRFMQQDVKEWAAQTAQSGEPALIFSNAALQWARSTKNSCRN